MKLLNADFSVCKTAGEPRINPAAAFCFTDRTDEVCQMGDVPAETIEREDGWKAFRIQETLDFFAGRHSGGKQNRKLRDFRVPYR